MLASVSIIYAALCFLTLVCLCAAFYAIGRRGVRAQNCGTTDYDEYFHRLFDETAIAYHDIDMKGIIRRVNRAECDLLGYEPEQLVGRPVWELVALETQKESRRSVLAKLGQRAPLASFQRNYVGRSGNQLTLEIHENFLFDEQRNAIGIRSALLDVSGRVRAEAELQESKRQFEEMANTVPVMLWRTGSDGQCSYVNEQWLNLTGDTFEQAIGAGWQKSIHPEDLIVMSNQVSANIIQKSSMLLEFRLKRFDGQYRWIISTGVPRYSLRGEFEGYIGSSTDVTERKQTEERLRLLESVVVNATEGVIITDCKLDEPGPRILYVNESFTRVTGYSREEVEGRSPRLLQGALTDKRPLGTLRAAMMLGKPVQVELLNYRKDGTPFWNEMDIVPIADGKGAYSHCIALQRDVTERKRIENEIQRYARELKQKNQALVAALAAAKESTELKSRFLANMSHEIRTPMNGIVGMIGLLLTTMLSIEQQEYAEAVQQSASSLLVVINDILDLSRIEAGRLELDCVSFDLKAMVEEAISLLAILARTKGLTLSRDLASDLPRSLFGDPVRIRQVITNLVGNAVKFTEEGGVSVSVQLIGQSPSGISIRVAVTDTGIGIPQEQCARLFHRFSQTDNSSTRKHGGSGLGLAISRQLVSLMGGEMDFETEAGKGSTFWFTLSLRTTVEQPVELLKALPANREKPGPQTATRVLIAEDNEINQRIALRILEKSGFAADAVANGRLALEAVQRRHYDLVLMDVQMPEMDGFEATAAIRNLAGVKREIPIIAMTANAMAGDRERCIAAGMDDYISKPVSMLELRSALDRWSKRTVTIPEFQVTP